MSAHQLGLLPSRPSTGPRALPDDGGRIAGDAYYTPDALAFAVVGAVQEMLLEEDKRPIEGIVWEPHVGGGAWARAVLSLTEASLFVSDLNPEAAGLTGWPRRDRHPYASRPGLDFLGAEFDVADWIVGNPPYKGAEAHLRQAFLLTRRHVLMLLRGSFGHSDGRVAFWQSCPPVRWEWRLAQRPSFTRGGGTDSTDYSLWWWDKAFTGRGGVSYCWDWRQTVERGEP